MLLNEIVDAVQKITSGHKALDYVSQISQFHRIQASPGIHRAIEFLRNEIAEISDARIDVFQFEAKGEGAIGSWEDLYAWTPHSATLELLEPEKKLLADFQSEPISLAAQSSSADCESEVVYIGQGITEEDYKDKDVKGKVVLTKGRVSVVHRIAVLEKGAKGILSFVAPSGNDEIAELRRYDGIWPRSGEADKSGFAFSLKQADGIEIMDWLEKGKKVKVRAKVDAKLGQGNFEVISALIEGKEADKEIWLIAHVCHPHPGANDNASGAGAILEVLRSISRLIRDGLIEQPQFSIRFIWVPEWHGTIKLIDSHPNIVSRAKFVINADMVGADPCKSGSILKLLRTPFSLPSTLNNVVRFWFEKESSKKRKAARGGTMCPLPFEYAGYSAGSDHFMFTDSTIGVPAIMLNQDPDRFYHTSTDTIDKIDKRQMKYVSNALTLSALTLSMPKFVNKEMILNSCRKEAVELIERVGSQAVEDLSWCKDNPENLYPRYMRWLGYAFDLSRETLDRAAEEWKLIHEQKSLQQALKASVEMAYTTEMVILRKAYEGACAEAGLEAKDKDHFDLSPSQFDLEVKRQLKYALQPGFIAQQSSEKMAKYMPWVKEDPSFMKKADELLNLCEDWRSLSDIYDRLCFQFGVFDPKMLDTIVKDLAELSILETKEV